MSSNNTLLKKLLLPCLLLASITAHADGKVIEGSRSFTFKENNDHVRELQAKKSNPYKEGNVGIEFYGHDAFKITSPEGLTMMIDPWRNDPTGAFGVWYPHDFPEVAVDIAMSSHAHFDHDAIYRTHATMNLERLAGTFQLADVKIRGIADKHQCHAPGKVKWDKILAKKFGITNICPPNNPMSWDNVVYIVETGGLRIGFWGDNRPNPGPLVQEALKNLDVLFMNIDGSGHILSKEQVNTILAKYKPKAIIPGHYLTKGAVLASSSLETADKWVNMQKSKEILTSSKLVLSPSKIEKDNQKVYYFGDHFSSK